MVQKQLTLKKLKKMLLLLLQLLQLKLRSNLANASKTAVRRGFFILAL